MERDDAERWKRIITQDTRHARKSLTAGGEPTDFLRARIAENEAILHALVAGESHDYSLPELAERQVA